MPNPASSGLEELRRHLDDARSQGNEAFKRGDDAQAVVLYTAGINKARMAGMADPGCRATVSDSAYPVLQLVATLYSNRAAAGLRLLRYEQVIYDASQATTLLVAPGSTEANIGVRSEARAVYGKARVRRANAMEALGNFMQAYADYLLGGMYAGDMRSQQRAALLSVALSHPIRYGMPTPEANIPGAQLPPAPPRRSSANIDGAVMRKLKCRLPPTCLFMQCAAWQGRIYAWGGSTADPMNMRVGSQLAVIDPQEESVTLVDVQPDSRHRSGGGGAPIKRHRFSMVLWRDALYVYGGDLDERVMRTTEGKAHARVEASTVWRLDLTAEPLTWQRIKCKGLAPAGRKNHTAAVWQDHMVVFGGEPITPPYDGDYADVWAFDLIHHKWRMLAPQPGPPMPGVLPSAPEPRREHASWVYGDWLYVLGGMSNMVVDSEGRRMGQYTFNAFSFPSMWRFGLATHMWEQVHYAGNFPAPRGEMAVAVSPKGAVYLAGGYSTAASTMVRDQPPHASGRPFVQQSAYSAELFEFCCEGAAFRRVLAPDMQPVLGDLRSGAAAAWLDGQVHVLGGYYSFHTPVAQRSVLSIDMRVCNQCSMRRANAPNNKLSQCSKCREAGHPPVYFCSAQCMQLNWPTHKQVCPAKGLLP